MNEIASPGQIRASFARWALVTVPAITGIGLLIARLSNSGYSNAWFLALDRPAIVPPGWVFMTVWPLLYILIALALAVILNARGAAGRGAAIALFLVQLVAGYAWSPLFFGHHQVSWALSLIGFVLALAIATTVLFARIRPVAAWLMLPYIGWLVFAAILNFQIDQRNPEAESLAPTIAHTNIGPGQGE